MADNWVSLHSHSDHSRLDAVSKISDLAEKAKTLGMRALALTDHGTISGWLKLFVECNSRGLKPIFGIESYICDDATLISKTDKKIKILEDEKKTYLPLFDGLENDPNIQIEDLKGQRNTVRKSNHVILLAKNKVGYHNIIKLSSLAYIDGFYYKPRIDLKMLEQYHEGIIATSACLGGQISSCILKDDMPKAEKYLQEYLRIFKDDFYIELQLHPVEEQKKVNKALLELAAKYKVETIIAQDHHYTNKEDVAVHEVIIRLKSHQNDKLQKVDDNLINEAHVAKNAKKMGGRMGSLFKTLASEQIQDKRAQDDSDGYFYNARDYYFKTLDELKESWKEDHAYITEEQFNTCIENTLKIADKIEKINAYSTEVYLPKFESGDLTANQFLKKLIKEGAERKLSKKIENNPVLQKKYSSRIAEEFKVISSLKFEEYFLIVWDIMKWCREKDIMTGDRGSVGGSLIAYCIDITNVDPIEYDLIFSRFINKTRSSAKYKIDFDGFKLEKK